MTQPTFLLLLHSSTRAVATPPFLPLALRHDGRGVPVASESGTTRTQTAATAICLQPTSDDTRPTGLLGFLAKCVCVCVCVSTGVFL